MAASSASPNWRELVAPRMQLIVAINTPAALAALPGARQLAVLTNAERVIE